VLPASNVLAPSPSVALWSIMRPLGRVVIIAVAPFGYSAVAAAAAPGHSGLVVRAVLSLLPYLPPTTLSADHKGLA
jgi:hypothetical protein